MFTVEELKNSKEFKDWIKTKPVLIHNTYHDSKDGYSAYIVLTNDMGKWTITRFWKNGDKIYVSVDYQDISTIETFEKLLNEYSSGLK